MTLPLIESHRGGELLAPENSWPAMRASVAGQADIIEVDVQLSRDGVPFLRHPFRLPDGRRCADLNWVDLAAARVAEEPLPRLDEVLDWAREAGVYLALDLKSAFEPFCRLHQAVVREIARANAWQRAAAIGWDHQELRESRLAEPRLVTWALLRGRAVDLVGLTQASLASVLDLSWDHAKPGDAQALHAAGLQLALGGLWAPLPEAAARCLELEADIVCWGHPAALRAELDRLSRSSS